MPATPKPTVLLTGASHGIGPIIAERLAREGFDLVIAARSGPELDRLAELLRRRGARAFAIRADLLKRAEVIALATQAEQLLGRVDVLVNNAGGDPQRRFHTYRLEELEEILRLNLTAALELARLLVPGMLERRRGQIVNISSLGGAMGFPHTEVYSAAKDGLIAFTKVFRNDYRGAGVSASVLVLGTVRGAGQTARSERETAVPTPKAALAFAVTPEKVAAAVVKAINKDRGLIVVVPGPGLLMKTLLDLFWGMGRTMNQVTGVTPVMLRIAKIKEEQAARRRAPATTETPSAAGS